MDDTENWKQRKVFKKQTENNSMNKVDGFSGSSVIRSLLGIAQIFEISSFAFIL